MEKRIGFYFLMMATILFFSCSIIRTQETQSARVRYELPKITDSSTVVYHLAYSLQYDEKYEQAEWVSYLLTKDMVNGSEKRKNNFRVDPDVPTGSASPKDYAKSGYDKGHLAPAGDFTYSEEAMSESFYMSNMSPQRPGFNRGVWKRLEELVREFAKENDSIYIATGPILKDGLPTIGKDSVAVPEYYYKVIAVYRKVDLGLDKGIGFILPNESSDEKLDNFVVTIDSVEHVTGINFFEKIPKKIQDKIESGCKVEEWIKEKTIIKDTK
jgi:endonuclease G